MNFGLLTQNNSSEILLAPYYFIV